MKSYKTGDVQDLEKPGVDEDPQQVLLRYQVNIIHHII